MKFSRMLWNIPFMFDISRYYIEKDGKPTMESLYEEWFYCHDLGTQLGQVIKR